MYWIILVFPECCMYSTCTSVWVLTMYTYRVLLLAKYCSHCIECVLYSLHASMMLMLMRRDFPQSYAAPDRSCRTQESMSLV